MKLKIIVFVILLLIIILFSLIIVGCKQQEYRITTKGEPTIFGTESIFPNTYYATKIISFDKTSVRFIQKGNGKEKFITAKEISIEKIK